MLKIEIITLKRAQIADNDEMEKFNTRKEFNFIKTVSKPFFLSARKERWSWSIIVERGEAQSIIGAACRLREKESETDEISGVLTSRKFKIR